MRRFRCPSPVITRIAVYGMTHDRSETRIALKDTCLGTYTYTRARSIVRHVNAQYARTAAQTRQQTPHVAGPHGGASAAAARGESLLPPNERAVQPAWPPTRRRADCRGSARALRPTPASCRRASPRLRDARDEDAQTRRMFLYVKSKLILFKQMIYPACRRNAHAAASSGARRTFGRPPAPRTRHRPCA
eukprot:IDg12180t1